MKKTILSILFACLIGLGNVSAMEPQETDPTTQNQGDGSATQGISMTNEEFIREFAAQLTDEEVEEIAETLTTDRTEEQSGRAWAFCKWAGGAIGGSVLAYGRRWLTGYLFDLILPEAVAEIAGEALETATETADGPTPRATRPRPNFRTANRRR